MKTKRFKKKLSLKKETISNLARIRGGDLYNEVGINNYSANTDCASACYSDCPSVCHTDCPSGEPQCQYCN